MVPVSGAVRNTAFSPAAASASASDCSARLHPTFDQLSPSRTSACGTRSGS